MKPVERAFVRSLFRFSYQSAIAKYYPYALQDLPKHFQLEQCLPPGAKVVSAKAFRAAVGYCVRMGTFSLTSDDERRMFLGQLQSIHSSCEKTRFEEDYDYEECLVPVGTIVQHVQFGYRGIVMGQSKSKGLQLLVDQRQLESMGTTEYDTKPESYAPVEGEDTARVNSDKLHSYFSTYSTSLKRYVVHEPLRPKLRVMYDETELAAIGHVPAKAAELCDNLVETKRELLHSIEQQLRKHDIDINLLLTNHSAAPHKVYFEVLRYYIEAHKKLQLAIAAYNNTVSVEDVLSVIPAEHWSAPALSDPGNTRSEGNKTSLVILLKTLYPHLFVGKDAITNALYVLHMYIELVGEYNMLLNSRYQQRGIRNTYYLKYTNAVNATQCPALLQRLPYEDRVQLRAVPQYEVGSGVVFGGSVGVVAGIHLNPVEAQNDSRDEQIFYHVLMSGSDDKAVMIPSTHPRNHSTLIPEYQLQPAPITAPIEHANIGLYFSGFDTTTNTYIPHHLTRFLNPPIVTPAPVETQEYIDNGAYLHREYYQLEKALNDVGVTLFENLRRVADQKGRFHVSQLYDLIKMSPTKGGADILQTYAFHYDINTADVAFNAVLAEANAYHIDQNIDLVSRIVQDAENINESVESMRLRMLLLYYQERFDEATEVGRQILKINPSHFAIYQLTAACYGQRYHHSKMNEYMQQITQHLSYAKDINPWI